MKLLLDIGNSRLKWASLDPELQAGDAIAHTGRSFAEVLDSIETKLAPTEIRAACVAAPETRHAVSSWAQARFGISVLWARSQASAAGVRNGYINPGQLGVDRWLAVIAAFHRARGAAFVVDAGTALTIDAVTADGRHLGGLIAPGVATQRQGLRNQTQLRASHEDGPMAWLAQDTDQAIALGTIHGPIGLIQRVCAAIYAEHVGMSLFLTGGEAVLLASELGAEWQLAPHMVLEGLALLPPESFAETE